MNPIYFLPIIPIGLIFAGIYFVFFAKQDQAREFVNQLFDDVDKTEQFKRLQQHHFVLRKHRKDQSPLIQKIDMELERANLLMKPNEFIMISLGLAGVTFLVLLVMKIFILLAVIGAAVALFLPKLYVMFRVWLRMNKARAQFADVLDTMVSCFKSGYGFTRAVQVVAENFEDPWSTELGKVATEMNFGSSQEDALIALTKRIPNADVALFVTAVLIQRETGGNLAELLTNLSKTIRDRFKLLSKVSALSAQGKLSAIIVFLIPFGLAGVFALMMPDMMGAFVNNIIGKILIGFALVMQLIGGVVLKNIVTLEV